MLHFVLQPSTSSSSELQQGQNSVMRYITGKEKVWGISLRSVTRDITGLIWELRNIYHHHHPESKKENLQEENSGFIHLYGRYGNAVKTRKTISTIAILWPIKAIFEKRAATVEVDTFISPVNCFENRICNNLRPGGMVSLAIFWNSQTRSSYRMPLRTTCAGQQ